MLTKKNKFKYITFMCLALLATIIFITACGNKSETPKMQNQSTTSENSYDKIPQQLTSMEDSIEKIFKTLNGPFVELKKEGTQTSQNDKTNKEDTSSKDSNTEKSSSSKSDSNSQNSSESDSGSKKSENSSGDSKSDSSSDSSKSDTSSDSNTQKEKDTTKDNATQKEQPKPIDPFTKITEIVNNLHYQWNGYSSMALQKNANATLIENFSNALNNLTNTINLKNSKDTQMAANSVYSYIPEFYSLYRTKSSPEIKRIRYYIRNASLTAAESNWIQAEEDVKNLKISWSLYKNTLTKDQETDKNKLDSAIYELEKVIAEKNQQLTNIKSKVALSNVQTIEMSLQKEEQSTK